MTVTLTKLNPFYRHFKMSKIILRSYEMPFGKMGKKNETDELHLNAAEWSYKNSKGCNDRDDLRL